MATYCTIYISAIKKQGRVSPAGLTVHNYLKDYVCKQHTLELLSDIYLFRDLYKNMTHYPTRTQKVKMFWEANVNHWAAIIITFSSAN